MTLSQLRQQLSARLRGEPGLAGAWGLAVAFALFVLIRGKDVSWDVRNYHWYNPYALLEGRRGFDIAVAQHATYYNPMLDVPLYAGAQIFPAWFVGLCLGLVHGLNAVLLYLLADRALAPAVERTRRSWIALAIAATGILGGMSLQLGGVLSGDLTLSALVLASLVVLIRLDQAAAGTQGDLVRTAAGGFLGGAAVGLKLAMFPFAFGLAAGIAALSAPWRMRGWRLAALAGGGLLGTIIFGGSWAFVMWRETGNPIFPYFNEVFGSPLLLAASYRDMRFLPHGIGDALLYPFYFAFDGLRVADANFRDAKLMLLYLFVPALLVFWLSRRVAAERMFSVSAARFLYPFAAVSYLIWLSVFAIYRYAVTLELLAPLLIAIAIDLFPVAARARLVATAAVFGLAIVSIGWDTAIGTRPAWGDRYIAVEVPALAKPNDTMVLMVGTEPSSYVIPSFPAQIPFLRIDSWLDTPQSHTRLGDRMRLRVRAHRGPLFGVFANWEVERAQAAFAEYGLVLDRSQCAPIPTNAAAPESWLLWCPLDRRALA